MRVAWTMALLLVACASEKLALVPPSGVDLSGHWRLNDADSDDPQRVAQSQSVAANGAAAPGQTGGQGGRGGGRGGRGTPPGGYAGGAMGPAMPGVGALSDGMHWPGRELDIEQTGGTVVLASMGAKQTYRPTADNLSTRRRKAPDEMPPGRESRRGDGPPAACGWDDRTLVVQPQAADDDYPPYEERYSLSADGQRLIEVVAFKGGRSGGFTVSRVWDRLAVAAPAAGDAHGTVK